jgi:hypothetical protein
MELIHVLKVLWRSRWLVAIGAAVALVGALVVSSRLSLMPPGLQDPTVRVGAASAEILVDAPKSALGDLRRETLPLTARSGILARFLGADGATDAIARESGIPEKDIAVAGPKLTIDGVPDQAAAERANKLRATASHLLQVQAADDLPLLTIFTQAPTAEGARKLANGTATALGKYLATYQQEADIPEGRRTTIRQAGTARADEIVEKPSPVMPVAAFCFLLGAWCFAILAWPRVRQTWSEPTVSGEPGLSALPDDWGDAGAGVLQLPHLEPEPGTSRSPASRAKRASGA